MSTGPGRQLMAPDPVGRGQRELIIWLTVRPARPQIILDAILNQKAIHGNGPEAEKLVLASMFARWPERSTRCQFVKVSRRRGARKYSIVIAATASDAAPLQFLRRSAGAQWVEYFRDNGMHALISSDDFVQGSCGLSSDVHCCFAVPQDVNLSGDVLSSLHACRALLRKLNEAMRGSLTACRYRKPRPTSVGLLFPTNVDFDHRCSDLLETNCSSGIRRVNVGLSVSAWSAGHTDSTRAHEVNGWRRAEYLAS